MDDISFEREGESVCALVGLDHDITLELWSDEATGYRDWEVVELDLGGPNRHTLNAPSQELRSLAESSPLRHAIDRAFQVWAQQEDHATRP